MLRFVKVVASAIATFGQFDSDLVLNCSAALEVLMMVVIFSQLSISFRAMLNLVVPG